MPKTKPLTVKANPRYWYGITPRACWNHYYDINGRLIMWDSSSCPLPQEVVDDMNQRRFYDIGAIVCIGMGLIVLACILQIAFHG